MIDCELLSLTAMGLRGDLLKTKWHLDEFTLNNLIAAIAEERDFSPEWFLSFTGNYNKHDVFNLVESKLKQLDFLTDQWIHADRKHGLELSVKEDRGYDVTVDWKWKGSLISVRQYGDDNVRIKCYQNNENNPRFTFSHPYSEAINSGKLEGEIDLTYTSSGNKNVSCFVDDLYGGLRGKKNIVFNIEEIGSSTLCTPNESLSSACTIPNGTGRQTRVCSQDGLSWGGYGACRVSSCNSGYHQDGNNCVANTQQICTPGRSQSAPCSIRNGIGDHSRVCSNDGFSWGGYGECILAACDHRYHQNGNICVHDPEPICTPGRSQSASCSIRNGTGRHSRVCSNDGFSWGGYGVCRVASCNNGYHQNGNTCVVNPQPVCTPRTTIRCQLLCPVGDNYLVRFFISSIT